MKKTHTLHRFLSLVLCFCMVLSMVPGYALPALAEEAESTCTCTVKCGETADTNCAVCSAAGADLTAVCIAEPANAEDGVVEVSTETELIAALANGGNIMLTGDITVSDEYPFGYDIAKNTAINLNGHTITGEGVFCLLGYEENIVLTISGNGTIKNTDPNFTSAIRGYGTLNILGGTIDDTNFHGPTIMSGGWVDQLHTDKNNSDEDTSSITGGYVGELNCWGGIVTISGGHVEALGIKYGRIIISGGTFGFDPTAYLAEGYTATEADGKWVVTCANGCEYTYSDNGDGTHTATCSVCGYKVTEEHSTEKEENKANCQQGDICDLCGTEYGEPTGDHTFDETGKCGDCNAHAVASLTVGETVTYYTTADGVFAAAKNSTGSATITILADARTTDYVILHDREDLALVVEEGAVLTLGYILYFSDPISGGGTIAGEGNGDILLYDGGTIDGVTVSTSVLNLGGAIIGGTFSQNVDVERGQITGGTFNGTVTNEGGQITGGIFHGAVINDIRYTDLEQPSISGGIFNNSVSNKGGLITGGTFNAQLTNTASLAHDPGVGDVEVCGKIINTADPTTFTLGEAFVIKNRDGTIDCASHIWKDGICRLCGKPCTHIGGTATCTEKAVCDLCGISYGEPAGHSFDSTTGKCTKCEAYIAVATLQVGESMTYYATADDVFTAAIAAQDGTVTILADTTAATPFYDVRADLIVLEGATLTVEKDLLIRGADVSGEGSIDVDENGRFLLEQGGTIDGVTVNGPFYNGNLYSDTIPAVIKGGTFTGKVDNSGCIQGGTFLGTVTNCADVMVHGTIEDGTFNGEVFNDGGIRGGIFNAAVTNWEHGVITNTETPTTFTLGEHFSITNEGNVHCTFHIWKDGVCRLCAYECTHKGSTHTSVTDLGDGNHSFICTVCGKEVIGHIADETVDQTCRGYFCAVCENWFGEADTTNHHSSVQYDNNGFCPNGCYEEAVWNEEDGVYEISNAGQLYWYAQYLNTTNAEIYAELTADIVIPENAPNWEPINASYAYFNGNFHIISGLKCIDTDAQYVGLFGMEGWWYEISNLHIDSSYFEGSGYVGAVVACMTNGGSITNCAVTNTTVQGDGDSVGTLAGYLSVGSVVNCFVDTNTLAGGYTNGYVTIENSYYLSETETEDGGKTAEQFASGEVAYLLQSGIAEEDIYDEDWNWIGSEQPHVWGQTVGQDAYPVLKGQKVYENLDCVGAVAGYANEIIIPEHSFVQGYCQVCGEPLGDAVLDGVTYVFGGVINGEWNLWNIEAPTYWVAGDGYAYFDPQGNVMTLDNVTLNLELWSSEEYGVSWKDDLVINFSGTNTLTTNDHNNGIVINVDGVAVMNGIGQNAVLNIISGADKAAQFEGSLTVNSGTVSFVSQDSDYSSVGVSTVALTVAEDAVVNVTAGNANYENGLSYGMVAEKLHVDGTLNASYGFCVNERQPWSCGVICTELTGSGTINALMLQLDQENMILSFTVRGKAVLASSWKATTDEGLTVTNTFTVAEGAILTIPEGVTLDLTGLPAENISIRGTILNNGTIICNHSVAEDDGDCTTDIPCLICHQPVIAGNDEHDWMDATCTTAKVCSFCGTTEGEALGHGTIEGFEYHLYSDYHEVWCTDCWDYSYQEDHTYGEDHYCICGAPEMFTVTFMNGDEVWITDNRYYNTKIAYVGMNYPTKEGYSFSGWYTAEGDPIANGTLVMGDMVVYAGFRINTYNYTVEVYTMDLFGNYGEPVVTTEAAAFGSIVDLTGYQTGEHFYLDGENINSKLYATVPANDDLVMRVYVVRKSYDITWILNGCTVVTGIGSDLPTYLRYSGDLGEDGWHYVKMLLDVPAGYRVADYVDGNGNSIAKESYNGHDRLKFYVTGDMTIEVVLEKETFDVTWIVDGTEFKETYEYGQVPVFTGSTDKANAGCAVYTFAGWNKDIVAVTCSASYTAIYNESFHHSWDDATCTEPKTCSACGTTEGEPLGHKWIYICNEPDTCSVCGATKDSVRQHTGYEDDGICDYCGMVAVEISLMDTDQRYFVFGQTGKDLVISVPESGHRLYYGAINRRTGENLAEGCVNRDGTFTIAGSLLDGMRMILVEVDPVYIFTVNVNGGSITDALKQALDAAGMQYTETYHERVYYIRYAGSLLYTGSYMREGFTLVGYELDGVRYGIDDPYVISCDDCVINLIWECNHNWTDATCTEPKTCTSCGETEGEALGHSYENNICTVCGSENVPVKLETAALSFQEKIHYNIFFSLNLSETVELADMGLVMFDSLNADGTVEDAIATYSGAVEMNGMYMVATDGVHAKCMGDTIYFRAYAKLADGSYVYSKTVEYSAVTYADHILNGDYSDNDKALVAAMLNYGAQAQLYFDYNTENLANANLTAEQKALVKDYASDLLAPVQKLDSSKTGVFASTGTGFAKKAPAVSFEGSFLLNYFFTPSETVAGDMTLYYWTEADYAAATELTAENATGSIVMTPGAQYHAVLDGIYAKDADATVYVAAVYSDGTATHCTGVLPYSIGAYLTSHAAKETNFRAMAQAAAVYCSYCKEYFKG